jgi:hypothetical protein
MKKQHSLTGTSGGQSRMRTYDRRRPAPRRRPTHRRHPDRSVFEYIQVAANLSSSHHDLTRRELGKGP